MGDQKIVIIKSQNQIMMKIIRTKMNLTPNLTFQIIGLKEAMKQDLGDELTGNLFIQIIVILKVWRILRIIVMTVWIVDVPNVLKVMRVAKVQRKVEIKNTTS